MQDKHKRSEEEKKKQKKNDRLASWNDEVFLHEWNIILNYTQSLSDLSWSKVGSRGRFGEEKVLSEAQKWRKTDCHLLLGREENKSNGKENGPLWMLSFFSLMEGFWSLRVVGRKAGKSVVQVRWQWRLVFHSAPNFLPPFFLLSTQESTRESD